MGERAPALPAMKFIGGVLSGLVMSAAALAALSLNAPRVHVAGGHQTAEALDPPVAQFEPGLASDPVQLEMAPRETPSGVASEGASSALERPMPRQEAAPPAPLDGSGPQAAALTQVVVDGQASPTLDLLTPEEPEMAVDAIAGSAEPQASEPGVVEPAQGPRIAADAELATEAPRSAVQNEPTEPAAAAPLRVPSEDTSETGPVASPVSPEAPRAAAWRRNAVPFASPADAPLLAIVLTSDELSMSDMSRLFALGAPVTFAEPLVDLERAEALRAAGFEILASVPLGQQGDGLSLRATLPVVGVALESVATANIRAIAREQGLLLLSQRVGVDGDDPYGFVPTIETPPDARSALLLETLRAAERRAARDGEALVVIPGEDAALTALARWAALPRLATPAPLSALAARRVDG